MRKTTSEASTDAVASNLEWKLWGRRDPLWAVAAWADRDRDGSTPWNDEEFYALGASDWEDFRRHWERYGLDRTAVVEIGCGAGRITRQLAKDFSSVLAIDVSDAMIEYARARVDGPHVRYELVDAVQIPASDESLTAAFSTHVFQHLESRSDAEAYFREIARVLAPGGTAMIHLPIFVWPWGAGEWVRRVFAWTKRLENWRARRERRGLEAGETVRLMRMHSFEMSFLYAYLPTLGLEEIEVQVFVTHSNNDPHPFVLFRKRGALAVS